MLEPPPPSPPANLVRLFRNVLAGSILALFVGAIFEYLSVAGVIDMGAARIILFFAWGVGTVGVIGSEVVSGQSRQRKLAVSILAPSVLAVLLFFFDRWAIRHRHVEQGTAPNPIPTQLQQTVITTATAIPIPLTERPRPAPQRPKTPTRSTAHPELFLTRFEPHKFVSGEQAKINVFYENRGPGTILMDCAYKVMIVSDVPIDVLTNKIENLEKEAWDDLVTDLKAVGPKPILRVPEGEPRWITLFGPVMNDDLVSNIYDRKTAFVFAVGVFGWSGERGPRQFEFCVYTRDDPRVVFACHDHNGLVPY